MGKYHSTQIGDRVYIGELDAIRVMHEKASARQQGVFIRYALPAFGFAFVALCALVWGV